MPPPVQPDPRVLAMIHIALDNGVYSPATQIALVQCFTAVFGQTKWWAQMLDDEPEIAALVKLAAIRTLH